MLFEDFTYLSVPKFGFLGILRRLITAKLILARRTKTQCQSVPHDEEIYRRLSFVSTHVVSPYKITVSQIVPAYLCLYPHASVMYSINGIRICFVCIPALSVTNWFLFALTSFI